MCGMPDKRKNAEGKQLGDDTMAGTNEGNVNLPVYD